MRTVSSCFGLLLGVLLTNAAYTTEATASTAEAALTPELTPTSKRTTRVGGYLATGHGTIGITPYRAAMSWDFGPYWREQQTRKVHVFWEAAVSRWTDAEKRRSPEDNQSLTAFTTGPQLRLISHSDFYGTHPYLEAGIGFSWLSRCSIGGRRLGIHFQFEDRVGGGIFFGKDYKSELKLNIVHYSNASIHRYNSGVNMYWIGLGRWF
ncbi:MAG: acyloxyacyl hydrolase [Pseudomonadota bacterium]